MDPNLPPAFPRGRFRPRWFVRRARPTTRRSLRLVVPVLVPIVLAGCRVQLTTTVDMDFDGTGTVTQGIGFDAAALARVGDRARALRADDLAQAGWVIESVVTEGGLTWISISHGFDTPEQADDLFAQLSSPDGPFRDKARADAFGGDASGGLLARIEKEEGRSAAEMVDPDLSVTTGGVSRTWSASFSEPSVQQPKDSDSRWKNPDLLGRVLLVVLVVLSVAVIALRIRVQGRARRRLMRRTARRW